MVVGDGCRLEPYARKGAIISDEIVLGSEPPTLAVSDRWALRGGERSPTFLKRRR